jgi:hypothetical protein
MYATSTTAASRRQSASVRCRGDEEKRDEKNFEDADASDESRGFVAAAAEDEFTPPFSIRYGRFARQN